MSNDLKEDCKFNCFFFNWNVSVESLLIEIKTYSILISQGFRRTGLKFFNWKASRAKEGGETLWGWTNSFNSFVHVVSVFSYICAVGVFLYLFPCFIFPDIYLSPSSSPFCFWPGLSLLHSHCIQQILESVNHCHINGIVHRDLKVSKWQH